MRYFPHFFLIAFSVIGVYASGSQTAHADDRPNILWIIAEDMGPELSCYGTVGVKTPVLDDLAKRGMLYKNAFTVTPVCSTSRSSFMTGMYAMSIDAHNHRSHRDGSNPLPDGVRVLTDWLRPAGYTTANIKTLTTDKDLAKFHKGTGKTDWNFAYPKQSKPFDTADWSDLKTHQPFYAQINFSETHRGGAWNDAHNNIEEIADPANIELPPYYPDHPVSRAVWAQYLNTVMAVDKKVGFILDLLKTDGLAENTIVVFLGDHGRAMPRGKQWPYDSGLHIPLIVYWPEGKSSPKAPASYLPGTVTDQLVASIDLTAATIDWAGVAIPEKMQGEVFMGNHPSIPREVLFAGRDRGDETVMMMRTIRTAKYRYIHNAIPEHPFLQLNRYKESSYPIIGLMRDLHAKGELTGPPAVLMNPTMPAEELYDIQADPWEIHNLADDPEYAKLKAELAAELAVWQVEIDDKGRQPEESDITQMNEMQMKKYYERLTDRPKDWYLNHPALGPYKIETPQKADTNE